MTNDQLLDRFIQLIAMRLGLRIRAADKSALCRKIALRVQALGLEMPQAYYQILATQHYQSEQEWQQFAQLLTTTESYFFRDRGQFTLLRDRLLPELIDRNQSIKTLRLWSAGCSTGEEPYSLAILLEELIPDWERWNLFILGTDINTDALEKAKRGTYSPWSFRLIDPQQQQRYFQPQKAQWQINPRIRQKVTFCYENLANSSLPNGLAGLARMDLIICRNVFVYFDAPAITAALTKFYHALKPGRYLLTGHTELQGCDIGQFQMRIFPESVVYQRSEISVNARESRVASISRPSVHLSPQLAAPTLKQADKLIEPMPTKEQSQVLFEEAAKLFQTKAYNKAIDRASEVLELNPQHVGACQLIAQIYANLGQYDAATKHSQQAIALAPLAPEPYYLLARVAEERGDTEGAKTFLKKIIYLIPDEVSAYLELASLYHREGNLSRAQKMGAVALKLLKNSPGCPAVEGWEQFAIAQLLPKLTQLASQLADD